MLKQIINFFKPSKEEQNFKAKHMPFYTESNWNYLEDYLNEQSNYQFTDYVADLVLALKKSIQPVKHRITSLLRLNNPEVFNSLTEKELEQFYDEMCEYKKRVRGMRYKKIAVEMENKFEERVFFEATPFVNGEMKIDSFYFEYFEKFVKNLNEKIDSRTNFKQNFVLHQQIQNKKESSNALTQHKKQVNRKRQLSFDEDEKKRVKKMKHFITPIKDDTSVYFLQRKINLDEFYKLDNPYYTCMEGENKVIHGRVPLEMSYFYNKYVLKEEPLIEKKAFYLPNKKEKNQLIFSKREDYMYIKEKEQVNNKKDNKLISVLNYYRNKFDKNEIESIIKNVEVIDNKEEIEQNKTELIPEIIKEPVSDKKEEVGLNISTSNQVISDKKEEITSELKKEPINLFAQPSDNLFKNKENSVIKETIENSEKITPIDLFKKEKNKSKVVDSIKPLDLFTSKNEEKVKFSFDFSNPVDLFTTKSTKLEEKKESSFNFTKPVNLFDKKETNTFDKITTNTKNEPTNLLENKAPINLFTNSKEDSFISKKEFNFSNTTVKNDPVNLFESKTPINLFQNKQEITNTNLLNEESNNKEPINLFQNKQEITPVNLFQSNNTKPLNLFNSNTVSSVNLLQNKSLENNQSINLSKNDKEISPISLFINDKESPKNTNVNLSSFNMFANNIPQSFNLFENIPKKESNTNISNNNLNNNFTAMIDNNLLNLPKRSFNFNATKPEEQKKKGTFDDLEKSKREK
ncbi:hypothetical protein TUBRATIS_003030 [Tubulinosema ratisbonensis]|uniref:Uncharacterized protein n=1 Tax=Tubulinosema ratisbonensis TaxID=291195 RepID=A0A437AQ88_9MICR|nr:hypothetical protein TUBRATIS_003030 [Tubulinosema ratisbonensis]